MLALDPQIDAICADQYGRAMTLSTHNRWVTASDAGDYYFGPFTPKGLGVLSVLPDLGDDVPVLLDIGAEHGTFLHEAVKKSYRPIRAVGFSAITGSGCDTDEIEWVDGDFQRTRTWQPADVLTPESVDVAVASLTFPHFIHPLGALENAHRILKYGGQMFVDSVDIHLVPETAVETARLIQECLNQNSGTYGFRFSHDDETNPTKSTIYLRKVHMERKTACIFDGVKPVVQKKLFSKLVYSV